ncbi:hypothetical protein BDW66DRAFT_161693 [Aspergillus desertorum]
MAACAITTALIALAVVGLRLYTRFFLTAARFQIDDTFICCATVCSAMLILISFQIMQADAGRHMCAVTMAQYNPGLGIVARVVILSKVSILVFYLRLSPQPRFCTLTFTLMGISTCYVHVYTFLFTFRCNPIPKNWDITITAGSCINTRTIMTVLSIANITMDILTLLLPVSMIMRLDMRLAQRVSVSKDSTWDITEQFYWYVPALKPFAVRHLATLFGLSQRYPYHYQARNGEGWAGAGGVECAAGGGAGAGG